MRVLLTRSEEDSLRIAARLKPHGITSIIWPVMKIEPVPFDGALPVKTDCVIVTSSAAVQTAPRLLAKAMCPVFCVGDRTAAMARAAGAGDVRSAGGEVGDLVTLVAGAGVRSALYLRGRDVATDLTAALSPHGIAVLERVTYAAVDAGAPESDVAAALEAGEIDAVTIWSSRSAARFCSFVATNRQWRLGGADLVGISDNAVKPLALTHFRRILVAPEPTASAMVETIVAAMRQQK